MPIARVEINGRIARIEVPEGTTPEQAKEMALRAVQPKPDNSRARGFLAGALKPLDNLTTWAMKTPPFHALDRVGQAIGLPSAAEATAGNERARRNNTRTGYQLLGNIAGTLPTAAIPGGVLAQGAVGGALLTNDPNDLGGIARDATIGAVAGKAGQQIGKRVLAPVAERVGRTAPARAVARIGTKATNRAIASLPPRIRPKAQVRMLPNPKLSATDKAVKKLAPQVSQAQQNIDDAARLGLPYGLADADPRLRTLAGSVVRKSPDARAMAEQAYGPRALGQADRAVGAIDDHLAPITNIEQRASEIRQTARTAAQPFYDEAYLRPAPLDDELNALLQTPAIKSALPHALDIAKNNGKDPLALGFGVADDGTLMIARTPTMETLDLVKQGLDKHLQSFRTPLGKLDLEGDKAAQSVNNVLTRFKVKLDNLSDDYRQARAVYSENIAPRTALRTGYDLLPNNALPRRQFDAALEGMDDVSRAEARRGYATAMADQVNRQRLSGNPYNAVYGSPLQQGKVGTLFPEGADDFNRIYTLENDMAATARETLGGSPTAARQASDQLFDSNMADAALDVVGNGGIPSPGTALRAGAGLWSRLRAPRVSEKKAAEMAPTLLGTDPQAARQFLEDLVRKQAEAEARRRAYQQAFGTLSFPAVALSNGGGSR